MQSLKLALVVGLWLPTLAFASGTVCSSGELYYAHTRVDMGVAPQPGTVVGHQTIVFRQAVLWKFEQVAGLGQFSLPTHRVEFLGSPTLVAEEGNEVWGRRVYRQQAKLWDVSQPDPAQHQALALQELLCEESWAMVP